MGVFIDVKEGGGVIEGEFQCIGLEPIFSLSGSEKRFQ
jgi:hypothetical protein